MSPCQKRWVTQDSMFSCGEFRPRNSKRLSFSSRAQLFLQRECAVQKNDVGRGTKRKHFKCRERNLTQKITEKTMGASALQYDATWPTWKCICRPSTTLSTCSAKQKCKFREQIRKRFDLRGRHMNIIQESTEKTIDASALQCDAKWECIFKPQKTPSTHTPSAKQKKANFGNFGNRMTADSSYENKIPHRKLINTENETMET